METKMTVPRTITGTLVGAKRLANTYMGNARFAVTIRDDFGSVITVRTQANSSFVYDLQNNLFLDKEPRFPTLRYEFHLNGRGTLGKIVKLV